MNDARVFALESRMNREEEVRIEEYEFMKDIIRKLVFSLEQLSIQHLDSNKSEGKLKDEVLPTLLNSTSTYSNKKSLSSLNETMEVMMMKRMNYIRNTIEIHDPKEVTSKIRIEAQKKRDERIMELWKKDLENPKISDLIANMRLENSKIPR